VYSNLIPEGRKLIMKSIYLKLGLKALKWFYFEKLYFLENLSASSTFLEQFAYRLQYLSKLKSFIKLIDF